MEEILAFLRKVQRRILGITRTVVYILKPPPRPRGRRLNIMDITRYLTRVKRRLDLLILILKIQRKYGKGGED